MAAKPRHASQPSTLKGLVWAFRYLGLYCYKTTTSAAAADAVGISLPLLLWAVFVKTCQGTLSLYHSIRKTQNAGVDVGTLFTTMNMILALVFPLLGQTSLLVNGRLLGQILSECDEDTGLGQRTQTCRSATMLSMAGVMTVLFYCSCAVQLLSPFLYVLLYSNFNEIPEIATLFLSYISIEGSMMLSAILFREVLAVVARQLSPDFLLDVSFLRGGAAGPDARLDALERKIRKVELLREKTIDFFLIDITIVVCSRTASVITHSYSIIREVMDSSSDLTLYFHSVYLMFAITTLLHLCYSTHHFSRHVHSVTSRLRDLRLAVHDEGNRAQLHYLISTLKGMETFDMGSWYHLGPNTLVSITTFVVTYLVVLLQVGKQKA